MVFDANSVTCFKNHQKLLKLIVWFLSGGEEESRGGQDEEMGVEERRGGEERGGHEKGRR